MPIATVALVDAGNTRESNGAQASGLQDPTDAPPKALRCLLLAKGRSDGSNVSAANYHDTDHVAAHYLSAHPATHSRTANTAALAFNVSKIVSTIMMSAPPSTSPLVWSLYATTSSSNVTFRKEGSSTFWVAGSESNLLCMLVHFEGRGTQGVCMANLLMREHKVAA